MYLYFFFLGGGGGGKIAACPGAPRTLATPLRKPHLQPKKSALC